MSDLSAYFAGAVRHHIARLDTRDWMAKRPGIDWLYAANGIFKRASNDIIEAQGRACHLDYAVPGLQNLIEYVVWPKLHKRLPGALLTPLLHDAQEAGRDTGSGVLRPIEKQYFFVERQGGVYVVAPRGQEGSAGSVHYAMPTSGVPLLDIHSHHTMRAFFSATDDRDDCGLSVSAVIGQIYTRPEIVVRLNIYGLHCPIPAASVFDSLGPFVDRYAGGADAALND